MESHGEAKTDGHHIKDVLKILGYKKKESALWYAKKHLSEHLHKVIDSNDESAWQITNEGLER